MKPRIPQKSLERNQKKCPLAGGYLRGELRERTEKAKGLRGDGSALRGGRARRYGVSEPERRASPRDASGRFRGLRPARIRSSLRPDPPHLAYSPRRSPSPHKPSAFETLRRDLLPSNAHPFETRSYATGCGSAPYRTAQRTGALACRARGFTPASPVSPVRPSRRAILTPLFHGTVAEGGSASLGLPPNAKRRTIGEHSSRQPGTGATRPSPGPFRRFAARNHGGSAPTPPRERGAR